MEIQLCKKPAWSTASLDMFTFFVHQITIEELMPTHTPVIQVEATDRDSGLNGRIRYSLQGTGADDFYINSTTGWIYNSKEIAYAIDKATVNLAIKASDGG